MGLRAEHAALLEATSPSSAGGRRPARPTTTTTSRSIPSPASRSSVRPRRSRRSAASRSALTLAAQPAPDLVRRGPGPARGAASTTAGRAGGSSPCSRSTAGRLHQTTAYFGEPFEAPGLAGGPGPSASTRSTRPPGTARATAGRSSEPDFDRPSGPRSAATIDVLRAALDPDYRGSFPQSGERFDFAGLAAVDEHYPGGLPEMQVNWLAGRDRALDRQPGERPGPRHRRRRQLGRRGPHALPVGRALLRRDCPGLPRPATSGASATTTSPRSRRPRSGATSSTGSTPTPRSADPPAGARGSFDTPLGHAPTMPGP